MPLSTLSAVTVVLRNLIKAAMPPKVEVSTLPLVLAEKFAKRGTIVARVNLMCHQLSPSPNSRNISLTRIDPAIAGPNASPLNVLYLVTVYGTPIPEQAQSTERLLEAVYRALDQKPVLSATDLEAALPNGGGTPRTVTARIVAQVLSFAEVESLFSSLQAGYRPTLAYQVTIAEE